MACRVEPSNEVPYMYAGQVERGPKYAWRDGFSRNGNEFPWLTKREAQSAERKLGNRAVFVDSRVKP